MRHLFLSLLTTVKDLVSINSINCAGHYFYSTLCKDIIIITFCCSAQYPYVYGLTWVLSREISLFFYGLTWVFTRKRSLCLWTDMGPYKGIIPMFMDWHGSLQGKYPYVYGLTWVLIRYIDVLHCSQLGCEVHKTEGHILCVIFPYHIIPNYFIILTNHLMIWKQPQRLY